MIRRVLLVGLGAGIVAGLAMAAAEMIYGWASPAHTAFDAPMGIWSYIGGLNHFGQPVHHIGPIVLGIGGHMLNAVVVGIVFAGVMCVVRKSGAAPILGIGFGAGLWALQRYVFLPINTPEDRLFTTSLINPQWVWWVSHVVLGLSLGIAYLLLERRLPAVRPQVIQFPRPEARRAA